MTLIVNILFIMAIFSYTIFTLTKFLKNLKPVNVLHVVLKTVVTPVKNENLTEIIVKKVT